MLQAGESSHLALFLAETERRLLRGAFRRLFVDADKADTR